jgi:hypothetical protein
MWGGGGPIGASFFVLGVISTPQWSVEDPFPESVGAYIPRESLSMRSMFGHLPRARNSVSAFTPTGPETATQRHTPHAACVVGGHA